MYWITRNSNDFIIVRNRIFMNPALGVGILIVAIIFVYFLMDPNALDAILNPPPDVKFYASSINKIDLKVGSVAILSINAINNEFESVDVSLEINMIGENAQDYLSYPETVELGTLEHNGSIFDDIKRIQITAKDVSGKFIPFDVQVNLIVDGQITDTLNYSIKIIP